MSLSRGGDGGDQKRENTEVTLAPDFFGAMEVKLALILGRR